jgi:hypothetical protein
MRPSKTILADPPRSRKAASVNILPRDQQLEALHLLVEGVSLRSVTRLTRIHRTAVMNLMVRAGHRLYGFLDARMQNLHLGHVQCDELWTFVRKKQGRLTPEEQADDTIGDQFLFVALDQDTKLIPSFLIGKRNKENTEAFMLDLANRMVTPTVGTRPANRPQISTDGWAAYPGAVDLAFADTVRHGVLIKDFEESEQPGRYGPPVLVSESRRPMTKDLHPAAICTSHVERSNLTARTFMRRYTRLALGFSKKLDNLFAATALYVAHYNFCRKHITIDTTPAVAAGLTRHRWSLAELLREAGME